MARKSNDTGLTTSSRCSFPLLILISLAAFTLAYTGLSIALSRPPKIPVTSFGSNASGLGSEDAEGRGECCRGVEHLELWGSAVKWGSDFKFNTSIECCQACKEMCRGDDGPCLCDSWVFCGDRDLCKEKFGECWLKKQKDVSAPALHNKGENVIWTSGIVFGKGEGIVGLETEYGTLHIKLFPECAPHSVAYIFELLGYRHCAGCQFYRAENRGHSWDLDGNHIADAPLGPPYGLIQGTLEAEGVPFVDIPKEACPVVKRGSVAWIGSGPEFIISLANHHEWKKTYTVFGSVLPEDMAVVEKIANLPTKSDIWGNINVSTLKKPVSLKVKKVIKSQGDLNVKLMAVSDTASS